MTLTPELGDFDLTELIMRINFLIIHACLAIFFNVNAQKGSYIFYDFILDGKKVQFNERKFSPLSNYLFVSDTLFYVGGENFREVKFPEEGELESKRLKSYFQFDGNNLYYHSDLLLHAKMDKQLLFELSPQSKKKWRVENFFSSGLAKFELRMVGSIYDSTLKDTVYSFKTFEYNYTVSHMPYTLEGLDFCQTKGFLRFEYRWLGKKLFLVQSNKKRNFEK